MERDELGRWLPGHSGNPKGHKPYRPFADIAQKALTPGKLRKVFSMLYNRAVDERDVQAAKLLLAYSDGLPIARVQAEVSGTFTSDPEWIRLRTIIIQIADEIPEVKGRLLELLRND